MTHYHVSRHNEDDDIYVTEDIYAALDYAATELSELADMEHEMVSHVAGKVAETPEWYSRDRTGLPSADEMEEALRSFAKSETYGNLQANAENMVRQHNSTPHKRAPHYQPDTPLSWGTVKAADDRLFQAALRVADLISNGSPLSVWECSQGTYADDEEATRCEGDRW